MCSDDPIDRLLVMEDPTTEFKRSSEIRDAAQRAQFKHADHEAVHRAGRDKTRCAELFYLTEHAPVWPDKEGEVGASAWRHM